MGDFTTQAAKLEHAENRYKDTTIEEAVAKMVEASGDDQNTVINLLAKLLKDNYFRLIYDECIEIIPDQKSVHVECRMRELGVREFLLQVAEKGWDRVYIVHEEIHVWLVTRERNNKGRILFHRKKIPKKDPKTGKTVIDPKTGKEKFIYKGKAVRDHKTTRVKYTGEPILFKKSRDRRNEFVKFLAVNDISNPWAVKEPSSKQKDTTETPKKRKNKYIPRDALGRLMLGLAKMFAEPRHGEIISGSEMLSLLKRNGATVKGSVKEYVSYTDEITPKKITVSKDSFEKRFARVRKHIKEIYPT